MVPWFGVYRCFHCCDARTSDVPTPTVTIAHPNLTGHLTFDEQYKRTYLGGVQLVVAYFRKKKDTECTNGSTIRISSKLLPLFMLCSILQYTVPELADQTYSAFSLVISESNSV
jgi:hypothetical protein